MASPAGSASGNDMSSVWASFAPPPPPSISPGPSAADQARRRSISYQAKAEQRERSRHDSLPPSSFSPAPPERSASRASHRSGVSTGAASGSGIGRSASPGPGAARPSSAAGQHPPASFPHQQSASSVPQSPLLGRPMSQDYGSQQQQQHGRALPRVRHDSAPMPVNGMAVSQSQPGAPAAYGAQPQQYAAHVPPHLQRSASVQSQYGPPVAVAPGPPVAAAPVVYGAPQYPYGVPGYATPPQMQHAYAPAGYAPPPQPVYGAYAYPQPLPPGYATPPQALPLVESPTAAAPPLVGYYAGPQYAAQPVVYQPPAQAVPLPAAPYPAPQPAFPHQQQQPLPPAPVQAAAAPATAALPPSSPDKYAVRTAPGSMGPPALPAAATAAPHEPSPVAPRASSSRPLPQPGRSFSLDQGSAAAAQAAPPAGYVRHAASSSLASSIGSVRRTLPQPPAGPSPVLASASGATAAGSSASPGTGSPVSAVPPGLAGTLSRTESVRLAAEALMSRGPPRRAGLGSLRSRMAAAQASQPPTAAALAEAISEQAEGSENAQENAPLVSSQSDPTAWAGGMRDAASLDSVTQNLRDITLANGRPAASSAQTSWQAPAENEPIVPPPQSLSPAPGSRRNSVAEAAQPAAFEAPERPRSRGAHHCVRQSNRNSQGPLPSFDRPSSPSPAAAYSAPGAAPTVVVVDRPVSPKPVVAARRPSQAETRSRSPAPARYEAFVQQPSAVPTIAEPPTINEPTQPSIAVAPPPAIVEHAVPSISVGPPAIVEPEQRSAPAQHPSVPTFSFGDEDDDGSGPSVPGISISPSDDRPPPPSISIGDEDAGPSISVSDTDDQRSNGSHSSGGSGTAAAQRATSSFAPMPSSASGPASASSIGSGATCGGCRKWIGGRVVQAMGLTWHPQCFRCSHCSLHLEHFAFYEHDGRPYCHVDYHELFSRRCFHCRTPIVDERFILIDDEQLGKRYYHDLHFFCANCGDPFVDPKAAAGTAGADEQALIADENGIVQAGGKAFVVVKGYPYCERCHVNLHHPRCKGCKQPITDDLITALKGKWHPHCFVCESCKRPFEGERFFEKDGKAWDEECYKVMLRNTL